jgi:hypothetical protein
MSLGIFPDRGGQPVMLFDKSLVCQDTNCPEMQPSKKYRPAKTSFDQALKKFPERPAPNVFSFF